MERAQGEGEVAEGDLSDVDATDKATEAATNTKQQPRRTDEKEVRKRRKYVRNACVSCKVRKVKCSGERNCSQCQVIGAKCEYQTSRKPRKTYGAREQSDDESADPPDATSLDEDGHQLEWMRMMARIRDLEANYSMLRSQVESTVHNAISNCTPSDSKDNNASPCTDSTFATLPEREAFRGSTAFLAQVSALDRSIAREPFAEIDSRLESRAASPPAMTWSNLPRAIEMTLSTVEKETRLSDLSAIRQSVAIFFSYLNPHYPCLNENTFRPLFEKFVTEENLDDLLSYADKQQFIALINLIHAEVRILSDEWASSARAPAWDAFCRAESILGRLTWLGNGNIMTIQCLLIKARYLLYAEKAYGAYDTMGRVVRLCWQLGLHYQSSWVGLSDFEVIMRQRIFWTVFYIDRHVALTTGAPYLIRQCDINVSLPPNINDKLLFPDQPLPPAQPADDPIHPPYMSVAVEWAHLTSEIWDVICSINAEKPTSAELIASMDARVRFKESQIPQMLQWSNNVRKLDGTSEAPHYVIRQSAILNQRMNLLRLLLRQETMLNLNFDDQMAQDCISVASCNIDAIYDTYHSPLHIPLDRFSSCMSLISSLLPLICVIVKTGSVPSSRARAIEAYNKAMALLRDIAPRFSAARHALLRMRRLFGTTDWAIRRFDHAEKFPFDPAEFEMETLVPQISDFFGCSDPQQDWELEFLNGELDGPINPIVNPTMEVETVRVPEPVDTFH